MLTTGTAAASSTARNRIPLNAIGPLLGVKMSGEDEKTQVSSTSPEVEASNGETKPEDKKEPVANGDAVDEEKDAKKPTKRKAASNKKVKESSDEAEDEEPKKSPKKKKAPQPKKSPIKKQKKEESSDEEPEETEPAKPKKPASPKKGTKESKKEKEVVDEDEEEEEEELEEPKKGVPLLDQPLEIEGSRARKKVARFSFNSAEKEDKKPFTVPEGKGTKLGDIPRIEHFISKFKSDDLRPVTKALFGARGPLKSVWKKAIRSFNGFDFDEKSDDWEKRKAVLSKLKAKELKIVCEVLDLERSGTVVELTERIMGFCKSPVDSGKKVPQPKRKSKGDSKKSKPKAKQTKSKAVKRKRASKKDEEVEESEADEEDEVDEEDNVSDDVKGEKKTSGKETKAKSDEASADEKDEDVPSAKGGEEEEKNEKSDAGSEEEEKDEEDVKKAQSKKGKKPAAKKAPAKAAKKAPAKKAPAKKKKKVSESEGEKEGEASSSEDDEPLVKMAKPQTPPSDEDIKNFVKKILEGANLEEITMKTVCKQVYENYPDHDLAHKKDLIKDTVKSLIST